MSEKLSAKPKNIEKNDTRFEVQRISNIFGSKSPMEAQIKRDVWNSLYESQFNSGYIKTVFRSENELFKKVREKLKLIIAYINRAMQNNRFKVDSEYLSNIISNSDDRVKAGIGDIFDKLEKALSNKGLGQDMSNENLASELNTAISKYSLEGVSSDQDFVDPEFESLIQSAKEEDLSKYATTDRFKGREKPDYEEKMKSAMEEDLSKYYAGQLKPNNTKKKNSDSE